MRSSEGNTVGIKMTSTEGDTFGFEHVQECFACMCVCAPMRGALNENRPHRHIGSDILRRCALGGVGVALLEEACHWCWV